MKCSAVVDRVRRRTGRTGTTTIRGNVNDSNASKVKNYKNYAINAMGMRERTLSEGKIIFSRLRGVLKGYVKATYCPKMKRIAKMKCSAVVDRAGGRTGRTSAPSGA